MTAYEIRSYTGNAADTVLNADMASTALTFSVAPGTGAGYPDGSQGPFDVFLDYDTSGVEKVRCTGRINDTFTIPDLTSRGIDGTTAQAHTANAKVRHGWTAIDAQEANRAAANTIGKITTKGDLLAGTGANALARVGAGGDGTLLVADSTQPAGVRFTNSGIALDAASSVGGVTGTTLAADHSAWQTYTPTLTNLTATINRAAYKQIGKSVTVQVFLTLTAATGTLLVATPVLPNNFDNVDNICGIAWAAGSPNTIGMVYSPAGSSNFGFASTAVWSNTVPFTWSAGNTLRFIATYQAA